MEKAQKCAPQLYILHVVDTEHSHYTSFRAIRIDPNEKLAQLHRFRAGD